MKKKIKRFFRLLWNSIKFIFRTLFTQERIRENKWKIVGFIVVLGIIGATAYFSYQKGYKAAQENYPNNLEDGQFTPKNGKLTIVSGNITKIDGAKIIIKTTKKEETVIVNNQTKYSNGTKDDIKIGAKVNIVARDVDGVLIAGRITISKTPVKK
jgi:hypothetical protein